MGVSGRRGTIEAIPQKRERDWTIVCYQGNYLFIQTEYVNFPEYSQEDAAFDFWFITVRIALNDAGEIAYMEYEYVPWG